MIRMLPRLLLIIGLIAALATAASPAQAQIGAAATISIVDTTNFPEVRAYVSVQRSDKTGVPNLNKTDFQLLENGAVVPITEITAEDIGLQIAIILDATQAFAIRDATTNTLLNLSRDSITNFAIGHKAKNLTALMKDGLDTVSIFAPEGVVMQSSNVGGEINNALISYQSTFQTQTQMPALIRQAINAVKADPPGRVPRKHIVIFSNGIPNANLADLTDILTKSGVRGSLLVHTVWVSYDDNGGKLTPEAENLQKLSNVTGGLFRRLYFANFDTATRGMWETIASQRPQYRFAYRSRVIQSGQQSLQVILNFDGTVKSELYPFSITVLPPTVTLALPEIPADRPEIVRRGSGLFPADTATYEPRTQKVLVQVKFPDGAKRNIAKVSLLIDNTVVEERTTGPFEVLTWNLSKYNQTGSHTLQVVVLDELGLEAKSDVQNILLTVSSSFAGGLGPTMLVLVVLGLGGAALAGFFALATFYAQRLPFTITSLMRGASQRVKEMTEPFIPTPGRLNSKEGRAFLEIIEGFGEPKPPIEIIGDNLKLGRDATVAQIVLADRSVSRLHARITEEADGIFHIHDEGSTSGTWVNYTQVPLTGQRLNPGDVINLGRIQLRFQTRPTSLAGPTPPATLQAKPDYVLNSNYSTEPFQLGEITSHPPAVSPREKTAQDHQTEAFSALDIAPPRPPKKTPPTDPGIKQ